MKEVLNFLGLDAVVTADKNIDLIKLAVEDWIQSVYCKRTLINKEYTERYDGTGDVELLLNNYPVVALNRLSIGALEVIGIKNTASVGHASVSVSASVVLLFSDGTTTPLSLTTYDTLTKLTNAINAVPNWNASLMSSAYGFYPSSELLEQFGLQGVRGNVIYLEIPDEGEDDFEVYPDEGKIYLFHGFPEGRRNIYVSYTAGYVVIPNDLKLATLILIKNIYQRRSEESFGVMGYSIAGLSNSFKEGLPDQTESILRKYKKTLI